MEDKTLVCKDCGKEFVWTAGEQEFYAQKGFTNQPTRCPECRKINKQKKQQNGFRNDGFKKFDGRRNDKKFN